jgi:AhpD family alkylhydroperoxidase
MKARLNYSSIAPDGYKAMLGLEDYLEHCSLEASLKLLVVLRASQLNHCAYCIDMHTKDLRAMGETEQRLYLLNAWRETPFFSPRERAALAWTEAVTSLSPGFVPDEVYEEARNEFSEKELVDLTLALAAINGWNRLCVAFRSVPGHYKPSAKVQQEAAAVSNA